MGLEGGLLVLHDPCSYPVAEVENGWRYFLNRQSVVSLLCNFDLYGRVLKRFLTHKFSCSAIQLSKTH